MSVNSISQYVDTKLFNKVTDLFTLNGDPKPLLITKGKDFGKWETLTIPEFQQLIVETGEMKVLRTIALVFWLYGLESPEFISKALATLATETRLDVFLEAAVFNSALCDDECREVLRQGLSMSAHQSALECVIALEAIDNLDSYEVSVLVAMASVLLKKKGVTIEDDLTILLSLAKWYSVTRGSQMPDFSKALHKCLTSIPKEGTWACNVCEYFGVRFRDILLFSYLGQDKMSDSKLIRNNWDKMSDLRDTVFFNQLKNVNEWTDLEKDVLVSVMKSGVKYEKRSLHVLNNTNFLWLVSQGNGVDEDVLFKFTNNRWVERWEKLPEKKRSSIMRFSMNRATDETLFGLIKTHPEKVKEAFQSFDRHAVLLFCRLKEMDGCEFLKEKNLVNDLYLAEVFSGWETKESYDVLMTMVEKYGMESPHLKRLLKRVETVNYDFLNEEEQDFLFRVKNEWVFNNATEEYYKFVVANVDYSSLARDILQEAEGGDSNE